MMTKLMTKGNPLQSEQMIDESGIRTHALSDHGIQRMILRVHLNVAP